MYHTIKLFYHSHRTLPDGHATVAQIENADKVLVESIRRSHQNANVEILFSPQTLQEQEKV
jgi:hypothetical protein